MTSTDQKTRGIERLFAAYERRAAKTRPSKPLFKEAIPGAARWIADIVAAPDGNATEFGTAANIMLRLESTRPEVAREASAKLKKMQAEHAARGNPLSDLHSFYVYSVVLLGAAEASQCARECADVGG